MILYVGIALPDMRSAVDISDDNFSLAVVLVLRSYYGRIQPTTSSLDPKYDALEEIKGRRLPRSQVRNLSKFCVRVWEEKFLQWKFFDMVKLSFLLMRWLNK